MNLAVVFEDLFHCGTIAKPIEVRPPDVFTTLTNRPAASRSFADKRVVMMFAVVTSTGAKTDGAKAGAAHQAIEEVFAACFEDGKGGEGVGGVGRLHEDVAHT